MGVGTGNLSASLARTYLLGALLRYNRVLSLPKVYSSRQISSTPRLAEPVCMRVCEGRKVTSTGSRSDHYWSRRRPVVVAIGDQYCFTQRPVLVTFPSFLRAYYLPPTEGVAGGSGGSRILA